MHVRVWAVAPRSFHIRSLRIQRLHIRQRCSWVGQFHFRCSVVVVVYMSCRTVSLHVRLSAVWPGVFTPHGVFTPGIFTSGVFTSGVFTFGVFTSVKAEAGSGNSTSAAASMSSSYWTCGCRIRGLHFQLLAVRHGVFTPHGFLTFGVFTSVNAVAGSGNSTSAAASVSSSYWTCGCRIRS